MKDKIQALLDDGNLIQAIKLYREAYGASLKDAKQAVEDLRDTGAWPHSNSEQGPPVQMESRFSEERYTSLLPAEHPISSVIAEQGWEIAWSAETLYNLDDGVLLLDSEALRFWTLFFDQWKEKFSLFRGSIQTVEVKREGESTTLLLHHDGRTTRFRKIHSESAEVFQSIFHPEKRTMSAVQISEEGSTQRAKDRPKEEHSESVEVPQGGVNWIGVFVLIVLVWGILWLADAVIGL